MKYKVADITLADEGRKYIDYAEKHMPVLMHIREKYKKNMPLKGQRISGCLHVTKETAVLIETLKCLGAEVSWSGCNPLSTNDKIAAALAQNDISIFAWNGLSTDEYYWCIEQTLKINPTITVDDGADLVFTIHNNYEHLISDIIGGSEETTTGVVRLKSMSADDKLKYPIVAVNDSETKHMFDNVYGTGQSSFDGILRATDMLIAGKNVVIAGYGFCGKGLSARAKGLGANVIVTEVDAVKALQARMDGYNVLTMKDASLIGDIFVTSTGMINVITKEHMESMKNGAVLANAGHYNVEINEEDLKSISKKTETIRPSLERYTTYDNKEIYLIGEGRLVNLVAGNGHPSEIMDMSFAGQTNAVLWLVENRNNITSRVYTLPREVDEQTALIKLEMMQINIDKLSQEQIEYMNSYSHGT